MNCLNRIIVIARQGWCILASLLKKFQILYQLAVGFQAACTELSRIVIPTLNRNLRGIETEQGHPF